MSKKLTLPSLVFITLLITAAVVLLTAATTLDISYNESVNYFHNFNELTILTHISTYLFGPSNISLRLPFILIYLLSIILFYKLSSKYINSNRDILIATAIFMALPGVISASLLVNTSILVIFSVLLYIYIYNITSKHSYILLVLFLFLDNSFAILFIALFFYSLKHKDNKLLIVSLILFGISMQMYGFDSGGKPKGFFIETVAIYSSIFSPFIFFYFAYSLYRTSIKGELDLLWYISTTTLIFSILLSFRQSIPIEDFAPFVVVAIPIMVKTFLSSYRVRLPQFRIKHKIGLNIAIVVLLLNSAILLINKPLYLLFENPKKHFAYKHHFAQEIATILKKNNITAVKTTNLRLQERLKFYGIKNGNRYTLYPYRVNSLDKDITIKYYNMALLPLFINYN
ncbi:MAG: glycosyltransferase family 39 protein [Campylobacterales bacterium]|nr:glycosyltransferase family 39 protein [Campylobacterales bacterium]